MLGGQGAASIGPRTGSTGRVRGRCSMRGDHEPAAITTCSARIFPADVSAPVTRPRIVLRRVTRAVMVCARAGQGGRTARPFWGGERRAETRRGGREPLRALGRLEPVAAQSGLALVGD